ncbi:MAG: hypothetical protein ACYDCK_07250 [Thermoplasmatota archaeon]
MDLDAALKAVPRPRDDAPQGEKTAYGTHLAKQMAIALSSQLREMGVADCRPDPATGKGSERSFAGGIGAKQVDVSLATEEIGLVLGMSIKGIYFPDATRLREDGKTYFAKNLVNRKGDMLAEATTLHKRFPFAVLGGLFFFDKRAAHDSATGKRSTYLRAHRGFKQFSSRLSHADAEEKYEYFALGLCDATSYEMSWVGEPTKPITLQQYLTAILQRVAEVNSDHFDFDGKALVSL